MYYTSVSDFLFDKYAIISSITGFNDKSVKISSLLNLRHTYGWQK